MRLKRVVDAVGALALLTIASPVALAAAIAIKLTSQGPILHRAVRTGRDGVPFTILKFRTMRVDVGGPGITGAHDPRITPVGRVLRRLKLDELPQLVNVIAGDMSLVGPRPEDPRYVERYTERQRRVLSVRPGLTSPAAIAYRDEEKMIEGAPDDVETVYVTSIMPAKLEIDLDYVDSRTLWGDIGVLVRTALAVLRLR